MSFPHPRPDHFLKRHTLFLGFAFEEINTAAEEPWCNFHVVIAQHEFRRWWQEVFYNFGFAALAFGIFSFALHKSVFLFALDPKMRMRASTVKFGLVRFLDSSGF